MTTTIRKVLVSPRFGAGWSSWAQPDRREFYLFDEALITCIEEHGYVTEEALADFAEREVERFGHSDYHGGARDLMVEEVEGLFRVHEYDGSERIVTQAEDNDSYV